MNTENNDVIGVYDNNLLAFLNIMEIIIIQLKLFVKIKEKSSKDEVEKNVGNYKLISVINNTNVMCKNFVFSFDEFAFCDNNNEQVDYFEKYNYPYINKKKKN